MTTYISSRNSKGMELNGNLLSGDTYPVKDYIKAYLGGKWNGNMKAWEVDLAKVEELLNTPGAKISRSSAPAAANTRRESNGLCPKCHTWCFGDCEH